MKRSPGRLMTRTNPSCLTFIGAKRKGRIIYLGQAQSKIKPPTNLSEIVTFPQNQVRHSRFAKA